MSVTISLASKVAHVTGGGLGIGKAITSSLAEAGAAVVIASRELENLRATAAEFADLPGKVVPIACHVDRRKKGTKHTLMVDRHGIPLAIRTAGANASDHKQIIPLVLDFPKVGGTPGRPKGLPDEAYADLGYDSEATRALLEWLGIEPHIAKRITPHGSGLGEVRWVVERTISWLKGLRRLSVRYDRLGVIMDAWTTLAASVICFRIL
jgi:transposase